MADTNTYDLFKKVEKWTTKEKFNALGNLTEIETGTEYNLAGLIDETDLASDLLAKINGKLTTPTTPTADSAVTMLADGTVGTKPLSEIGGGGGKLHRHAFAFKWNNNRKFFYYYFYNTRSTAYSDYKDIIGGGNYIGTYVDADTDSYGATAIQNFGSSNIRIKGAVSSNSGVSNVSETVSQFVFVDTVTEV